MQITHAQGSTHWHTQLGALFVALTSFVGCVLPHANPMPIDNPPVGMDADVVMGDVAIDRPDVVFDVTDPCPMNQTRCGPNCVDLNRSVNDCGRCGNVCTPGSNQTSSCQLGICANICSAGFLDCNAMSMDGCEVNSATDPMNCGGCNTRCGANSVCTAGVCQCAPGFTMCGGACINFQTNVNNCGACGTMCAARANSTVACTAGMCRYTCLGTHADCNMNLNGMPPGDGCEVVLGTPANCLRCADRCVAPTLTCTAGAGCANGCAPLNDCGGMCVNFQANPLHCGGCGRACAGTNATPGCTAGACTPTCNAGFGNCDMNGMNGCETNINSDNANCGGCGIRCGNNSTCMGGVCRCDANFGNCNNMPGDGCEARLDTLTNCNACGMACGPYAQGTATCSGAVGMARCGVNCNAGTANCDNNLATGCEVDTRTDRNNCGACGTVCPNVANGTPSCVAGVCGVGSCNAGFGNCDNMAGNGCEVDLRINISHCNGCGMACATPANAAPTCIASACGLGACNAGFGNCDMMAGNGCETNTNTTVAHCGMCGNACATPANGTAGCTAGSCTVASCSAGFGNCDAMAANGCEARLNTNARCGACGTACMSAVAYCGAGPACTGCGAGLRDCNNDPSDMCEVNISNDVNNCNACGTVCMNPNGTTTCTANACVPVCNPGFANCDALPNNGCETNTETSNAHCGACNNACVGASVCTLGVCESG